MSNTSAESRARFDRAFHRHSRPQLPSIPNLPTKPPPAKTRALDVQSKPSWISSASQTRRNEIVRPRKTEQHESQKESSWVDFVQLGHLTQGELTLTLCCKRIEQSHLYMFQSVGHHLGPVLRRLQAFQHPNLLLPTHFVRSDRGWHFGQEYARFTIEEVLKVHVPMQELHLHILATSVFDALKFLYGHGLQHGSVSISAIRLCGRTGNVILGNCAQASLIEGEISNLDLENLGLVILDCMEGQHNIKRSAESVRETRTTNKVFGLAEAEKWSGCKQLIDFLDDLFGAQRRPRVKFEKRHDYVNSSLSKGDAFVPFAELASMECFTMWQAAR